MNAINVNVKRGFLIKTIAIILVMLMFFTVAENLLINKYVLAANGWDVLIFVSGALIGGAIYDYGKWKLTSGAIAALTPAGAAAVLAGLGALGLIVYAVHMNSSGSSVNYYENQYGCIMLEPGRDWICPHSAKDQELII